jgi:hypothetical protein
MSTPQPHYPEIDREAWSTPGNALRTLCVSQADWAIHWHLREHYKSQEPKFLRRGLQRINGRPYDVYDAVTPNGPREYWMDVSYWFGRGLILEPVVTPS